MNQDSNNIAEADGTVSAPVDRPTSIQATRVWRFLIVLIIVLIGGELGGRFGAWLVDAAVKATNYASTSLIARYHDIVIIPLAGMMNVVGFTAIGGLSAYLLGTAVYNTLERIGNSLRGMQTNEKIALAIGTMLGLVMTAILAQIAFKVAEPTVAVPLTAIMAVVFIYFGLIGAMSMKEDLIIRSAGSLSPNSENGETLNRVKILDTNVIIDGRVADICHTGFIEGSIYVPGFVLDEIQLIADSSDSLKRARGRRGLDILNQMRSELPLIVRTLDAQVDFTGVDGVDSKLVRLAKQINGMIVTNDFNLNKVAELQGVAVLNINELANALKPVVLPGEEMRVTVIKEGKESNQGVAYLDDGTMIVIDGGRRHIGETLDVMVSSVLQTVAGKMIFAQIRMSDDAREDDDVPYEPSSRAYSGSRMRRPIR